jgi:hypothetical protein
MNWKRFWDGVQFWAWLFVLMVALVMAMGPAPWLPLREGVSEFAEWLYREDFGP